MKEKAFKKAELKLISELMKNSRRSDRELAKAAGVSQPTVSRFLKKLENEGVIREYTIIPDFSKLGYGLLALNFVTLRKSLAPEEVMKARKTAKERVEQSQFGIVMLERGIGLGFDGVIVSLYKDYTDYAKHKNALKNFSFIDNSKIETFLIDLHDKVKYRPLSFRTIAEQLFSLNREEE